MAIPLFAQVVKTPQIFYTPVFSETPGVMTGAGSWVSFRHVLNQQQVPDFGHDWKCGVNINIFSSSFFAVSGLAEETFHFSAAPEPLSEWIFNAGSIISDLRLLMYINLNPVLIESGFQHDCKHEVDRRSVRLQIHDLLFLAVRPGDDFKLVDAGRFLLTANMAVEGGINLPAVFQEAPPQPDLRHAAGFFRICGEFLSEPQLAVLADGSVSLTQRTEDTLVTGLAPLGIDCSLRGGIAVSGETGRAALYLGVERLTDSWTDFNEEPVDIHFISVELTSEIN